MRKTILYGLFDPISKILRYIGKTQVDLKTRLRGHVADSKRYSHHRANWIKSLLKAGLKPQIRELMSVEGVGCREEIALISVAQSLGYDLVNGTSGGEGTIGRVWTQEQKQHMSHVMQGKNLGKSWKLTPETKQRMSVAAKGRVKSAAHRAAIGKAMKNKPWTPARWAAQKAKRGQS